MTWTTYSIKLLSLLMAYLFFPLKEQKKRVGQKERFTPKGLFLDKYCLCTQKVVPAVFLLLYSFFSFKIQYFQFSFMDYVLCKMWKSRLYVSALKWHGIIIIYVKFLLFSVTESCCLSIICWGVVTLITSISFRYPRLITLSLS